MRDRITAARAVDGASRDAEDNGKTSDLDTGIESINDPTLESPLTRLNASRRVASFASFSSFF
jgi:hypothetical protein